MAQLYTDPKTGITRDQYGNEVAHDPASSIALAAILAAMLYSMTEPNSPVVTSPNERTTTEPVNRAPPQTP